MKVLGEGTYGKVFKCINQVTNDIVALKRNQIPKDEEHEGIPSTTLRELSALT
jgi:serine/threonine protein kinase